MLIATLALSVLIGVSLGLLGGGGSILTVPILVYVAGLDVKAAIAMSLLVVGTTSAAGAVTHARAGRVQWRTGLVFGVAGMVGAYGGGRLAEFIPGMWLLVGFGVMMAITAVAMLRDRPTPVARAGELAVGKAVAQGLLRRGFGWFVVAMAMLVLGQQVPATAWAVVPGSAWTWIGLAMGGTAGFATVDLVRRARTTAVAPMADTDETASAAATGPAAAQLRSGSSGYVDTSASGPR